MVTTQEKKNNSHVIQNSSLNMKLDTPAYLKIRVLNARIVKVFYCNLETKSHDTKKQVSTNMNRSANPDYINNINI